MTPLRLATRGSPLALWQAEFVARSLAPRSVELVIVRTEGDRIQSASLADIGGRGVFTKEVQVAVLNGDADLAVHSLKDLPTEPTPGLTLAATPERGPAGDVLVSNRFERFDQLPEGARVATGSLRRRAMLRHRRPDLDLVDIRGNIDTRLNKLDRDDLDAILLAEAGLARLGLSARIREVLDPTWMIRAVGQGALGIECRSDDAAAIAALAPLNHARTLAEVRAERAFLRHLGGGCQTPIAAAGRVEGAELILDGVVLSPCGAERIDARGAGPADDPDRVGRDLATELLARGAARLLN
jgi:hydroxymethylbilane synthase